LFVQGLDESDLACGGHTPICEAAAFQYVREGAATPFKNHIYNNCSGKHAGFLSVCKFMNYPLQNYLDVSHPLQQLILDAICDLFGLERHALHIGLDGCSAPTVAVNARYCWALALTREVI
jgi:L-asparaginase II